MIRLVFALVVASLSFGAEAQSKSPVDTRAYAPENIGSLPVSDQIRVIEKEYREQSRGRQIPDDQLDFYLDQIKYSRWTFSKIKNDISVSMRGNSNWNPPPGGNWNPGNVICSSKDRRYNECRTPFRGRARLVENISNTRCVEGRNWGSRQGLVWVDDGCRGRFVDSGNGWGSSGGNWNNGQTFHCESEGGRYLECRKPYSGGNTVLVRQMSSNRCTEGYSWGEKRDIVWVSNGCRGEFRLRGGNSGSGGNWNNGYTVTCSSYNGALRTCSWDRNRGEPRLIERLAGRCSERVDWGYDSRGLWLKNSCSARFGPR